MAAKREIKTLRSSYLTDDVSHEFTDNVNKHLKDGWTILSSACAACVFFDQIPAMPSGGAVIHRHTYTVIIYKESSL